MLPSEQDQEISRSSGPPWNYLAEVVVSYSCLEAWIAWTTSIRAWSVTVIPCVLVCWGLEIKICLKGKILIIPWWWKYKLISKVSSVLLTSKVCWMAGGHLSHVRHIVFLYAHLCFSLLTKGNSCKEPAPLELFKAPTQIGSHP